MKNVKVTAEVNKQALSVEEMENVGGGFLLNAIAGIFTVGLGALYGFADMVSVGLFGMPDLSQYQSRR